VSDKFEFIDAEYAAYQESGEPYVPSIVKMCTWMEVSRSGFYSWRDAPESATARRRGMLALYVRKSFGDSGVFELGRGLYAALLRCVIGVGTAWRHCRGEDGRRIVTRGLHDGACPCAENTGRGPEDPDS
jgi:hypothetical protein